MAINCVASLTGRIYQITRL